MKITLSSENRSAGELLASRELSIAVASLPRSGSSLMTRILSALSVNMIQTTDLPDQKKKIDERQLARYGAGYHMNPEGFGEVSERKFYHNLLWLSTPWSGIKMIYPLNPVALELLTIRPCRVIQMVRSPESIRASLIAAYGEERAKTTDDIETFQAGFAAQMREAEVAALPVSYDRLIAQPVETVETVAEFINAPRDLIAAAAALVDPAQKRF